MSSLEGFLLDLGKELVIAHAAAECYDNGNYLFVRLFFVEQFDGSNLRKATINSNVILEKAWSIIFVLGLLLVIVIRSGIICIS